jgi:hypothetical protein
MHVQKQNQVQNNLVHKLKKQVVAVKKRADYSALFILP